MSILSNLHQRARELGERLDLHQNTIRQMVKWLQSEPALVAEIRSAYSHESLPPWLPQLVSTTKSPPPMTPPPTTTGVEEDEEEDVADSILPEEASSVGDAEVVDTSGADPPRVVVSGGGVVVGGGGKGGGKPPVKQAPPEPPVKPKERALPAYRTSSLMPSSTPSRT